MHLKKLKYKYFIAGIISGIILGSVVTYITYRYNIPVIERISYIKIPYFSSDSNSSTDKETLKHKEKRKGNKENKSVDEKINSNKQSQIFSERDTAGAADINLNNKVDSVDLIKNGNAVNDNEDNNIVVVKDQMISIKEIPLSKKDIQNEAEENKVSSVLTDNNDNSPSKKLLIEFWKSPLNYKGYKMSEDKLIIYGIEDTELAKFIYFNNTLYLEYSDQFYRFDNSEKFRSLSRITNSSLINQLKQIPK
jgi:hypothetical protein